MVMVMAMAIVGHMDEAGEIGDGKMGMGWEDGAVMMMLVV